MSFKYLFLTIVYVISGAIVSRAENPSLFHYDKDDFQNKIAHLNLLEEYVNTHEGVTLEHLYNESNSVIQDMNLNNSTILSSVSDGPLGVPSFIWGCCLSWVGILIVYLVVQDSEEVKLALWGCLLNGAVVAICYVVYFMFILYTFQ